MKREIWDGCAVQLAFILIHEPSSHMRPPQDTDRHCEHAMLNVSH
jgi:hypothetical protein